MAIAYLSRKKYLTAMSIIVKKAHIMPACLTIITNHKPIKNIYQAILLVFITRVLGK